MGIICGNYSKEPQSDENIDENYLHNQITILDKEKGYILKILLEKNKNNKGNYRKYNNIYINNKQIKKSKENRVINQNQILLESNKNMEVENNQTNENLTNIELNNINNINNNIKNNLISPDFYKKNDLKIEKNIYFSLGVSDNSGMFMEMSNNENNSNNVNNINNKDSYNINPTEKNGDNDKDNITKTNNLSNDNNSILKSKILENNIEPLDMDSPKDNNSNYNIINKDEKNNPN